jgi:hypothetical protein
MGGWVHCTFRVRVQEDSKPGHELQRRVMHVCVCAFVCTCLVWVHGLHVLILQLACCQIWPGDDEHTHTHTHTHTHI